MPNDKLNMRTANLAASNIAKIAELFPHCATEIKNAQGKLEQAIDFELLKQELSPQLVDGSQERYRLDWVGKRQAILEANTPIAKTLRPAREESVNFDNTANLFIEGDNLDALKLLQESYLGKVKMIYIDPPYNTGKDFVYRDKFSASTQDFLKRSAQVDDQGNRLVANSESNGRFHSDWLSMMYSRLKLARNLLSDDAVIVISVDDNEQANLKKICDEIFGQQNRLAIFNWQTKNAARGVPPKTMVMENHEYLMCYSRDISKIKFKGIERSEADFHNPDNDPRGLWRSESMKATGSSGQVFSIINPENNKKYTQEWAFSETKVKQMLSQNLLLFPEKDGGIVRQKKFINSYTNDKKAFVTNLGWYSTENSTKLLMSIFDGKKLFDFPKPLELIKFITEQATEKDDLILDFFAGSATTAHAVMDLNAQDAGKRKFIMVQLPEVSDENSAARKAGYENIAQIAKERMRRAGNKILADYADTAAAQNLDVGFRVLKIASSNMENVYYTPESYNQDMLDQMQSNIKADRSGEDLLYQVMLDWGLPLDMPIKTKTIQNHQVYCVGNNSLLVSFDAINAAMIDELAKLEPLKFVSCERAITTDHDKSNIKERFKQLSPNTEVKFI